MLEESTPGWGQWVWALRLQSLLAFPMTSLFPVYGSSRELPAVSATLPSFCHLVYQSPGTVSPQVNLSFSKLPWPRVGSGSRMGAGLCEKRWSHVTNPRRADQHQSADGSLLPSAQAHLHCYPPPFLPSDISSFYSSSLVSKRMSPPHNPHNRTTSPFPGASSLSSVR